MVFRAKTIFLRVQKLTSRKTSRDDVTIAIWVRSPDGHGFSGQNHISQENDQYDSKTAGTAVPLLVTVLLIGVDTVGVAAPRTKKRYDQDLVVFTIQLRWRARSSRLTTELCAVPPLFFYLLLERWSHTTKRQI